MKLRGLLGTVAAGLMAMVGLGKTAAPSPRRSSNQRVDFTMPLTLPARRTAERNRRRNTPAQRQARFENRQASIPTRVWHKGPVQSVPFQHACGSGRRRSKRAELRYGPHWRAIPADQLAMAA